MDWRLLYGLEVVVQTGGCCMDWRLSQISSSTLHMYLHVEHVYTCTCTCIVHACKHFLAKGAWQVDSMAGHHQRQRDEPQHQKTQ